MSIAWSWEVIKLLKHRLTYQQSDLHGGKLQSSLCVLLKQQGEKKWKGEIWLCVNLNLTLHTPIMFSTAI